jgi:hypothetical protein
MERETRLERAYHKTVVWKTTGQPLPNSRKLGPRGQIRTVRLPIISRLLHADIAARGWSREVDSNHCSRHTRAILYLLRYPDKLGAPGRIRTCGNSSL